MKTNSITADFFSLFFPRYCLGCSGSLVRGEDILCTGCLGELPKTNYHFRAENPIVNKLMGRLQIKHAWAFLKFQKRGIVQQLLHKLKYENHPEIGERLGLAYGIELGAAGFANEIDLIVPVPLHQSRQRKRGYNQSLEFAKGIGQAMSLRCDESISIRTKATPTQTNKSKAARWENVKDVFSIDKNNVKGMRILLVDDVITTGATLEACGQHLVSNGCNSLSIACIADAS